MLQRLSVTWESHSNNSLMGKIICPSEKSQFTTNDQSSILFENVFFLGRYIFSNNNEVIQEIL